MPPTLKSAVTFSETTDLDAAHLLRLFHQAPWAKNRTVADATEMLRQSDLVLCAWDGDRLVGFARVLTDFVYRATIWDVIVDQAYQKQGIGTQLVQRMLNHPRLNKESSSGCAPDVQGFMKSWGSARKSRPGWSGAGASKPAQNDRF